MLLCIAVIFILTILILFIYLTLYLLFNRKIFSYLKGNHIKKKQKSLSLQHKIKINLTINLTGI